VEKAKELLATPAGEEIALGCAPRDRLADRGEERPLRPVRHRGAARGRAEVREAAHGFAVQVDDAADRVLDDALKLLSLPRVVGSDAEGVEITAQNGRYGPYLKKGTDSRSLVSEDQTLHDHPRRGSGDLCPAQDPWSCAAAAPLKELGNDPVSGQPIVVKSGRFGEYVTDGEYNATLRKDDSVEDITPSGLPNCSPIGALVVRRRRLPSGRRRSRPGSRLRRRRPPRRRPRRRRRRRLPRRSPDQGIAVAEGRTATSVGATEGVGVVAPCQAGNCSRTHRSKSSSVRATSLRPTSSMAQAICALTSAG
jgi:DNA topoisomerase-1